MATTYISKIKQIGGNEEYVIKDAEAREQIATKAPLASPALTGTPTAPTAAAGTNTTQIATTAFVTSALTGVSSPMRFIGSLGTGGTATSLPTASATNQGYTYKVITANTYQGVAAKVGDMLVSDGSSWILIPSGDEPSGTVTSVGVSNATNGGLSISGSPVTTSGTISIGHSNVLSSAQTTQAVYPIKIDKNGHISAYGNAVSIPSKTSDLTNDSKFVNASEAAAAAPVQSVNGQTGAVTLTASNINAVAKTGDTMTGNLTLLNKSLIFQYLVNGNNFSTELHMIGYNGSSSSYTPRLSFSKTTLLQNISNPSANTDAANKAYVDSAISGITHPVTSVNGKTGAVTLTIPDADDHKWNDVALTKISESFGGADMFIPYLANTSATTAKLIRAGNGCVADTIATYSSNGHLYSRTPSANDNSTKVATTAYVDSAINNLPEPMVFKGSLGTGGTITTLPTASSSNTGFTYKVITAGTYASQTAKVGDIFISDGTAWVLIPSGDEPSGTVTSVGTGVGLTGGSITSSGTIKAKLRSETALTNDSAAATETSGRVYPVAVDKSGYLAVNVPWTNVNDSYVTSSGVTSITLSSGTGISVSDSGTAITSTGSRTISLASINGLTTGTYGPTGSNTILTPSHEGTFTVPTFSVDTYGRITSASNYTVKLPSDADTKVKQTASSTNTDYKLLFTTTASPTSGTAYETYYDSAITVNPSTDTITATTFNGTATKATAANIATTQNSIAKYSNTTGTFANSGVTIDSNNNLIVPSTSYAQAGNITIGGTTGSDQYTIKSNTTLQLDKNANTSIIFSDNGTEKIRIDTNNAFRPEVDSTLSIGTENYKWNNVYANTYNGAMANSITIGDKSYNGSEDVTLFASDLGVSSALNFAGVIYETLPNRDETGYPSTQNPVHLYIATGNHQGSTIGDGSAGSINPGTVVICHDTQDEFLWSEDSQGNQGWYSLGLASSFALHNHTHGNIENAGTMVATINGVSSTNKAVVTDASNVITIADLSTEDPNVQNNATSTSFISSITQDSKGKITAVKSNISDVYVKKSGDTMTGNLYMGTTNQVNGRHLVFNGKNSDGTATRTLWMGYANDNNVWYFWDSTNNAPIIVSNNSGLGGTRFAGNADTATTLATARNINGTSFNGSANITTANWGTARNISIADSDGTNTGTAVSVNGSAAVTLKLPATIKASLNGNATTATAFSSNATVTLTGDTTGTSAGSTKSWSVSTTTNQLSFKNGRIASADLDISTMHSKMLLTLASSSMTTNKPPMGDGYIVTYGWDNAYWGAQQAISHTKTPHMAIRGTNGESSSDWGNWIYLLDANNYTSYTVTKTGTGASGTWGINITGNSATATRATNVDYLSNATHSCSITKSSWTATNPWNMGNKTLIWGQAVKNTSLNSDSGDICLWYGTHTTPGGAGLYLTIDGGIYCLGGIYGAVWNDYAEYRKDNTKEKDIQIPGKCVREVGDGSLALTTKRLERGCEIISDTFGFAIGQDEENGYNTPIASNGRVLAYPYESIEEFASHIGYPVCSGPDGTVSIMTDEEEEKYPSRIIGTISEIPSYEEWGTGKVKVNGRVWIRIK